MELSSSMIKKFLIFREMELSSVIFSYISRENFPSSKTFLKIYPEKKTYFEKWNFLGLIPKRLLCFRKQKP